MMTVARQNIKSLPQWAQDYIQELEARAQDARAALDKLTDDAAPTNIEIIETIMIAGQPSTIRRYVPGHRIVIWGPGVTIDVLPN